MTNPGIEAQRLLQARTDAFTAIRFFLRKQGPIDNAAKQAELERLRRCAEAAVQACEEASMGRGENGQAPGRLLAAWKGRCRDRAV